jgi:hypothetical protein
MQADGCRSSEEPYGQCCSSSLAFTTLDEGRHLGTPHQGCLLVVRDRTVRGSSRLVAPQEIARPVLVPVGLLTVGQGDQFAFQRFVGHALEQVGDDIETTALLVVGARDLPRSPWGVCRGEHVVTRTRSAVLASDVSAATESEARGRDAIEVEAP